MAQIQTVHEAQTGLLNAIALVAEAARVPNHTALIPFGMNLANPDNSAQIVSINR